MPIKILLKWGRQKQNDYYLIKKKYVQNGLRGPDGQCHF